MKKIALFILFTFSTFLSAQPLLIAYGYHDSKPYAFIENGEIVGGVKKDIIDELKKELNIEVKYVNVPRKRLEFFISSGLAHLELFSNPNWYKKPYIGFSWTKPIFKENDILVINKKDKKIYKSINDLKDKFVGTMLGYVYPNLEDKFKKQIIYRDDAESLDINFKKLIAHRIDALIASDVLTLYYIKENYLLNDLEILNKPLASNKIYVMVSKKAPISFKKINEAFIKLKKSGKIQEILNKYK